MPAITTAILAATAVAGVATSVYGMSKQQSGYKQEQAGYAQMQQGYQAQAAAAAQAAGYNKAIAGDEQQQDQIRRTAMQVGAKRDTIQAVRQAQQARSMSIAAATAQGAGFAGGFGPSSGYSGGAAQVNSRNNFNILGINQNLQAGEGMFNLNADITQQRIGLADTSTAMANAQGTVAMGQGTVGLGQGMVGQGQGYMSLGGQLVSSAGTFANVATSLGGFGKTK